jgi:hypothetical protein
MFSGITAQILELAKIPVLILSIFVSFVSIAVLFRGAQMVLWALRGELGDRLREIEFSARYERESRVSRIRKKKQEKERLYREYAKSRDDSFVI